MSNIKDYFVSRFENGTLMELDYSQLEVIALAVLSGDENLKADLMSGMDMHRVRAAEMLGVPESRVTEYQRKIAKAFSFQLQYGAQAKSMAEKNGTSVRLAQSFIDSYYTRYWRVKEWQDENIKIVQQSRRPSSRMTKKGMPAGMGYLESETGRKYVFFEEDSYRGTSFSPTKIKNYPVQGFATGDIVPIMLGELLDWSLTCPLEVLLVNTVHDSVLLDINCSNEDSIKALAREAKEELEGVPTKFKDLFAIDIDLPMKVDVEVGKTWGSMKKLDI